jgi:hypothetical protein
MAKLNARRAGQLALPVQEPQASYWRGFLEFRALFELTPDKRSKILTPRCVIPAPQTTVNYGLVGQLMGWIGVPYARSWTSYYKKWPGGSFVFYGDPAWAIASKVFGHLDPTDPRSIPSPLRERISEVFQWRQAREKHEQLVWVAADYGMKLEGRPRPPASSRSNTPELDRLID